jgi:Ankyrin repeats (3 copies)
MAALGDLPGELLEKIYEYMDTDKVFVASCTCKALHAAALRTVERGNHKPFAPTPIDAAIDAEVSVAYIAFLSSVLDRTPGVSCTTYAMDRAVRFRRLDILQWLHAHRREGCSSDAVTTAARLGFVDVLEWFHVADVPTASWEDAMDVAAAAGQLEAVRWLAAHRHEGCTAKAMDEAAANGYMDVLEWLHVNTSEGCTHRAMDLAALNGHLDVLRWLHDHTDEGCTHKAMDGAAGAGHLAVVQWLHEKGHGSTFHAFEKAIVHAHGDVAKWLHTHRPEGHADHIPMLMDALATTGNLELLSWMRDEVARGQGCSPAGLYYTVVGTSVTVAEWVHANCPDRHTDACLAMMEYAMVGLAASGRLEMMEWLHAKGLGACSLLTVCTAARAGQLCVLEWMHQARINITNPLGGEDMPPVSAVDAAAEGGHLHVLKWLQAHASQDNAYFGGGRASQDAMDSAASRGFLEVVKWLHVHRTEGCSVKAMDGAARAGHLRVVQWLHANRREGCTKKAMDMAARYGHLDVVRWLHANRGEGCSSDAMDCAAAMGHLDVVEWLHANRSEGCTNKAMDMAAANGHTDVVKWLHANRGEGCTERAIDGATERGDLKLAMWLQAAYAPGCTHAAMQSAARLGCIEVVKWLHESLGMPCSASAMKATMFLGHFDILTYLCTHNPDPPSVDVAVEAVKNGDLRALTWIHRRYPQLLQQYAQACMDAAAGDGDIVIVKWLAARFTDVIDAEAAIYHAAYAHELEVAQWLYKRYKCKGVCMERVLGRLEEAEGEFFDTDCEVVNWLAMLACVELHGAAVVQNDN